MVLTHWGRLTHICVIKVTVIGSDNGLSPDRHQAIIWTNAEKWLIGPLGTNFDEILIKIHTFSFKKIHLKMSSGKWRPFCLSLNVLTAICHRLHVRELLKLWKLWFSFNTICVALFWVKITCIWLSSSSQKSWGLWKFILKECRDLPISLNIMPAGNLLT